MKLEELYRSGTTDNEDMEGAARMAANFMFASEFAHEAGLEQAFNQLFQLPEFKQALEKEFTLALRKTISSHVRQSQIPPGEGWTDDYIVNVAVNTKALNVAN